MFCLYICCICCLHMHMQSCSCEQNKAVERVCILAIPWVFSRNFLAPFVAHNRSYVCSSYYITSWLVTNSTTQCCINLLGRKLISVLVLASCFNRFIMVNSLIYLATTRYQFLFLPVLLMILLYLAAPVFYSPSKLFCLAYNYTFFCI